MDRTGATREETVGPEKKLQEMAWLAQICLIALRKQFCFRGSPDDATGLSAVSRAARAFEAIGRFLLSQPESPILPSHDLSVKNGMQPSMIEDVAWQDRRDASKKQDETRIGRKRKIESRDMGGTGTILFSHTSISRAPASDGEGGRALAAAKEHTAVT